MAANPAAELLLRPAEQKLHTRCLLTTGKIIGAGVFSALVVFVVHAVMKSQEKTFDWSSPFISTVGSFDRFAITTDHTLCAHAGKSVITAGGNAVEAAVAAMFCLGATNPQSSGLGGGFLMTVYNATTGRCAAIDAREVAPKLANQTMFVNNSDASVRGFLAIGVPSELAGYWEVYRRFGSGAVKWSQLVKPTIDILEDGLPVSDYLGQVMKDFEGLFRRTPSLKLWINPSTNETYKEGEKMPRARLLKTLKKIAAASNPVQLFYHREFAEIIDKEVKANGGILRKEDLAAYRVRVHDSPPVAHLKNGLAICGGPPPSGFVVTQLIVNLMSHLYPNSTSNALKNDAKVYHHLIESRKFAYALRSLLGDPSFVPSAGQLAKRMLTPEFLASTLEKITDHSHKTAYYGGDNKAVPADFGTSSVSVLDGDGNGVAATTTINRRFGAVVESEELGIVWNDEMDDFSTPGKTNGYGLAPSETNFIAPGKRPMSSMSPLIVYDEKTKKIRMVAGASGGSRIISAVAKTVTRRLVFGETLQEAIDAPGLHNQITPDITQADKHFPGDLKTILQTQFGQQFKNTSSYAGVIQAIHANPGGKIEACGDARRKTDQTPAGL
ncbi:hypothetical protein PENTCL1PPCAC_15612 [Pristionchus entomophagus]|uniref:Gamma-glutamyltranspeptidase n=1 Tax=Pristionchus entomophagus TaxID=358040 RepID=A0AAV5TF98_9BILA|nr:hypothetical protein PENTCL1PPCAC_15612 [Pristionchus entomophagus]